MVSIHFFFFMDLAILFLAEMILLPFDFFVSFMPGFPAPLFPLNAILFPVDFCAKFRPSFTASFFFFIFSFFSFCFFLILLSCFALAPWNSLDNMLVGMLRPKLWRFVFWADCVDSGGVVLVCPAYHKLRCEPARSTWTLASLYLTLLLRPPPPKKK